MGRFNRWNDTIGIELKEVPVAHGEQQASKHGWTVGKHARE